MGQKRVFPALFCPKKVDKTAKKCYHSFNSETPMIER